MKKQINLYQPSCYPKREKVTFKQFIALSVCCIISVVALVLILNYQMANTKDKTAQHNASFMKKQTELSELATQLKKNRVPELKLRQQRDLQEEIVAKQRLLASLSKMDLGITVSFSQLMRGLSLANTSSISIERFSIIEGRLNMSGKAQYSDSVALWLSKVQTTKELSDISFEKLTMSDLEDTKYFSFELSNSIKSEPVKALADD